MSNALLRAEMAHLNLFLISFLAAPRLSVVLLFLLFFPPTFVVSILPESVSPASVTLQFIPQTPCQYTMVFNVLFLAALCTEVVSGLAFEAARATQHAKELESGWTPAPTSAPRIPHELLKRQSSAASSFFASTFLQGSDGTCGYLSGSVGMY